MKTHALLVGGLLAAGSAKAQTTTRVDVNGQQLPRDSTCAGMSSDGRFVAFNTDSGFVVPNDANMANDAFLFDRATGAVELISVNVIGLTGIAPSSATAVSSTGRFVAFTTLATDIVPGYSGPIVRDRVLATSTPASVDPSGTPISGSSSPSMSVDGRWVSFWSSSNTLVAGDTNSAADVFVRDMQNNVTVRASVSLSGAQANSSSFQNAISGDGRFVAFVSLAWNLVPNDADAHADVFVRDLVASTTECISVSPLGVSATGSLGAINADGRFIAFLNSSGAIQPGVAVGLFVRDRLLGTTTLASVDVNGAPAALDLYAASFSADGSKFAFDTSDSLAPSDINSHEDVYVRDLVANTTTHISVDLNGGSAGNWSSGGVLSADGRVIAFTSHANDMVVGDTNQKSDAFVRDYGGSPPTSYCAGGTSSNGCTPTLSATGVASLTASSGFTLQASNVDGNSLGIIFFGLSGAKQPGGSGIALCLQSPLQRLGLLATGGTSGACDGAIAVDWNAWLAAHPGALGASPQSGLPVWTQAWIRNGSIGRTTSNALFFTVGP